MVAVETLPIDARLDDVRQALREYSQVLLVAEPGAGKTTRVPPALLDEPWCRGGKLLLLEPRRVAARLAARYMAEQRGEAVGESIGYRMRGDSRVGPTTRMEVVTQGVLTRMLQDDPMLEGVAGIVFDEFHERSLEADLGLALALDVQEGLREDLRLLVMSATLDVEALRSVLGDTAPLIECPGRAFPVETRYRPLHRRGDTTEQQAVVVREALAENEGDLLVFLPGVADIRRLARNLARLPETVVVHELHGRMTLDAQQRALRRDTHGRRRIVLATAIAESSVTVDGVRTVIDAGFERVPVFQPRNGMTRLATQRLNRASADQRRGRAGRQAPGSCYRLWAEEQPLPAHGEPEIVQADLSGLAFELARWGVKTPEDLPWITPPPTSALAAGRNLLQRLGILDETHSLTPLGRACARWPTHPRLAVMLERSEEWQATPLACWLAALLEGRDSSDESDFAVRLARRPDARAQGAEGQWYRDARRLADLAGCRLDVEGVTPLGELLALAYPERVAQRIEPGRFKLASGGQAVLDPKQALAHAEALVAVELDGQTREARIFRAAEVALSRLEALFPETRHWQARLEWLENEGRLQGEEVRALGELILERRPLSRLPEDVVQSALIQALRKRGRLPLDNDAEQLQGRIALLRRELGDTWPDWSTEALLDSLETWLAPHLVGISRLDAVERLPMARLLLDALAWSQRQALDELAPTHLQVPSGSRIRLDYRREEPVLAVKLQELFGLGETPRVIGGRLPVVLHLLSPARRPLQVTRDLASFWANGYPEVRKDMRGRYPKHPWPDDPTTAIPTAGSKRRW
ncbi:ATP-dependent helicase HrpB [Litchfieldella anticariensis]|uniref:ATP-dependent helicase HrpB n=1 Tax=Litchfieldella anticariensis TaxID=258591 RepID=UPI000402AD92|nr:ATP-dependent helicase HrpB [Halomonas anticariensis]